MPDIVNNTLYTKLKHKKFSPNHVAEIGVWHPDTSNIYSFIKDGIRTTLVEPDPESIAMIKTAFAEDNIELHEVAIFDSNCTIELCKKESSTFVKTLPSSPTLVNDDYQIDPKLTFSVDAKKFDEIDDGSIELISIDTEGSEWYAIQNMVSRPSVISLETHGGMYVNPFISEIKTWLKKNHYQAWYKEKSDTVFVKEGAFEITFTDKMNLILMNTYLFIRAKRKKLKKLILSR